MGSLKPVRWKEGLFLRPHHLQQFELYIESREVARLGTLESHNWGITRFKLNPASLDNYIFDVVELQAVMPDGSFVDVPGNARLSKSSFERFMTEGGATLDVHLGIRAREERRPLVREGTGGQGISRFNSVEHEVYDLDTGEGRAPLEFLEYDLRCFFGDESQQGYDVLPLTRLYGTGDPAHPAAVEASFAPPSLTLNGADFLRNTVREVLDRLGVVQRELGSNRHSLEPDKLVIYQAVSGSQPVLKDMVHDGMIHPRRVYHELSRLTGALLAAAGRTSDEVPPYEHRRPAPVFDHLRGLIEKLTPAVIDKAFLRVDLPRGEDDGFSADLPQEARQPGARCFLEVLADETTHRVPQLLLGARTSSRDQIPTLIRYALPGVPTERLPGPPPEVGDGRGTYFRLKQEHDDWTKHVVASGNLTIQIQSVPKDVKLALIVVKPKR